MGDSKLEADTEAELLAELLVSDKDGYANCEVLAELLVSDDCEALDEMLDDVVDGYAD